VAGAAAAGAVVAAAVAASADAVAVAAAYRVCQRRPIDALRVSAFA
jgi:hypothetical protein